MENVYSYRNFFFKIKDEISRLFIFIRRDQSNPCIGERNIFDHFNLLVFFDIIQQETYRKMYLWFASSYIQRAFKFHLCS